MSGINVSVNGSAINKMSQSSPLIFANASVSLVVVMVLSLVPLDSVVTFTANRLEAPLKR